MDPDIDHLKIKLKELVYIKKYRQCPYVYVKGESKGKQCHRQLLSKFGNKYCSRHHKLKLRNIELLLSKLE